MACPASSVTSSAAATLRAWRLLPSSPEPRRAKLFLCHGTHEHCGKPCYCELAAAANAVGIEVFAIDFAGHGRREGNARGDFGELDDAIRDLVELVVSETLASDNVPVALFGHSLGSMVAFLAAHELATNAALPTPACVVLSGFAMDSISPPFGFHALVPVLRAMPSIVRAVCALLAQIQPTGPACPLPPPEALMRCPGRAVSSTHDPLQYNGWIQNRTALALLDGRRRCHELLASWGRDFPFLLIHGEADELCPLTAPEALMAKSPQKDKTLKVYAGSLHELLNDVPERRDEVRADVVEWLVERLKARRDGSVQARAASPATVRSKL